MSRVAIVIGHGPKIDRGAVSLDGLTNELDWNTDLAVRMASALAGKLNVSVVRRSTEQLQPVKETNATNADFAIELHLNSTPSATGTEMIHAVGSKRGKTLATLLQQAAVCALGLKDRGVKTPWQGRGARWLNGTRMPAVIVESFFIDNDSDLAVGNDRKQALAEAYADALVKFDQIETT